MFQNAFVVLHILVFLYVGHVSSAKSKVIKITSENWRDLLDGEWLIKFYAPWCPACRSMEEDYKMLADWSDDLNMQVAEVDINKEAGLSGRFIVTALPTIYHAKNGEFRRYSGARDTNSLHKYVEEKAWRWTDPVSWYRHPNSIPMTLMSGLFQTSVLMKNFHETLTESYGFSNTVSYIIFALATIATGLILGLIMVFIIDCVAPPKAGGRPVPPAATASEVGAGDAGEDSEEQESADDEEDNRSTGGESLSGSEKGEGDAERRGSKDASESEEDRRGSQASSKSSSQTSQEWEKVQGEDAEGGEENAMEVEKDIEGEVEEVKSQVRKRNVAKDDGDKPEES